MKTRTFILAIIAALLWLLFVYSLRANTPRTSFYEDIKLNGAVAENVLRLAVEEADGEVMSVSGLPNHKAFSSDDRALWLPRYHRPEKAEEVKITLHTKDGRTWRAVWEEIKP